MPKKHKPKGNRQQNPHKRRSDRRFDSEDESGPKTSFSLRDEVFNTGKHHSQWSPSVKLRNQGIQFVSAGSLQPPDEPKVELQEEEMIDVNVENEQLDAADDMDIGSGVEAIKLNSEITITNEVDVVVEEAVPAFRETLGGLDGTDETPLFTVDVVGDASLKQNRRGPHVRVPSPTGSNSSEEVIMFRGRKEQVTIRDDPPSSVASSTSKPAPHRRSPLPPMLAPPHRRSPATQSIVSSANAPSTSSSHVTDALMQALDSGDSKHSENTKPADDDDGPAGWLGAPPRYVYGEPEVWHHSDGTVGLPTYKRIQDQKPEARTEPEPELEPVLKVEAQSKEMDAQGRKSKKSRKRQNRRLNQMQGDLEDELLQDYIDNMSEGEKNALKKGFVPGMDEDEWISSEMDEEADKENSTRPAENSAEYGWATEDDEDSEDDEDQDDEEGEDDEEEEGDDTDLEEELEYTEREMWEDEADLRQRQIDAMTDEDIARILAKQEDLGIGGDDIYLFDDSGFGDLETARAGLEGFAMGGIGGSKRRGKRGGRKSDKFPDATLMADVLEQDPYGGFDIMDFDRPSLKAKSKGRKSLPAQLDGLSDEELVADIQSSWANDRQAKKAKKAEREELRSLGLLGSGRKKGKVDMGQKYSEGMNFSQLRAEIELFLETENDTSKAFPPMAKEERKILHEIANRFNLTSGSRGSGKNRFTLYTKNNRTIDFDERIWNQAVARAERSFLPNMKAKGKGKRTGGVAKRGGGGISNAGAYRHGEVVGGTAPEIAESNFGRRLMEKMGWQKGMALGSSEGAEGRLLVPVAATVKTGRGGLG